MTLNQESSSLPHLCQQFGFTTQEREKRLLLMNLGEPDIAPLQYLQHKVIQPMATSIMDRFYQYLLGFDHLRLYLGNQEHIDRLKNTQLEYLLSFGLDFHDAIYFEYRLRIGIAHERIGLPLHMYLAAYRHLQTVIYSSIPAGIRNDSAEFTRYLESLQKIVMLDISLAIDAYTRSRANLISASLQAVAQERDRLTNQLMYDSLTKTLSRRFILETLSKQLALLSRKPDHHFVVALLDLDNFKQVNDNYGHLAGDKVLYDFCDVVNNRVRKQDYFGRFGGEEFLLILTEIPTDEAFAVLNRIREATQLQNFTYDDLHIPLTTSIGFTAAKTDDKVDDLIERADNALYQAKSTGRNQVVSA